MNDIASLNAALDEIQEELNQLDAELAAVTEGGVGDPGHYFDVLEAITAAQECYEELLRELEAAREEEDLELRKQELAGRG